MDIYRKTRTLLLWQLICAIKLNVLCIANPTNIIINDSLIQENQPVVTIIDTLKTIDSELLDTFTYQLVTGIGDTNNSDFLITDSLLFSKKSFDYESKSYYVVRIRTTDSDSFMFEKYFHIYIVDVNEPPTDLFLAPSDLDENSAAGTVIGNLTSSDPDANQTFTYSLVTGIGDTNNNSFTIAGNSLRSAAIFDYDIKRSYSVRIRTTDAENLSFDKIFRININNINQAPTNITLSPSSINEGQPSGTIVGTLTSDDPDSNDTFTYSLIAGVGDTNNSSFTVSGDNLISAVTFDYDVKKSFSVRVRTTDAGGQSFEKILRITINNVNQPPTNITLSPSNINEGQPIGTIIGTLASTDPDPGETFTYSLVTGTGDTNNSSFAFSGNSLISTAVFDYDIKKSYSVRIRTTDAGGQSFEKIFRITINNINQIPTNITLSPSSINEGQPSGTIVGALTSADPDTNDTFTYSLVAGVGDTNNSNFTISGNNLRSAAVFDYNIKKSYSVRIRTTDAGGQPFEKIFRITINNINQPPTNITLTPSSINEGQPIGTIIGILTSTDPDPGETFTYSLVTGIGDTNNSDFAISGNSLISTAVFDYDVKKSYSIRLRTTDAGGLSFNKIFRITINNINQPPTNITLSPSSINEGQPSGTIVGALTSADPDANDTFTYSLVAGVGDTNNNSFTISGNNLRSAAVFDYNIKKSYSVRVRTTDAGGQSFEKFFRITINNINQPPTNITLTPSSINEGQPIGTIIGILTSTDPDPVETFTYSLVAGIGDTNNSSFSISGNSLISTAVFDYDAKKSYSVRIRTTDAGGLYFNKIFRITINNINQPPTNITLSPSSINEGQPSGTIVGALTSADPDADDTFTYTLVAGAGDTNNSSFTISGNNLRSAAIFDYDTKKSYSIRIRTTDAGGQTFEKIFRITVNNINQPPTNITLSPSSINEGQPIGSIVGTLASVDADSNDTFTYLLVSGAGDTNNSSFTISGNILRSAAIFDYNTKKSYSVRIRTRDAGGLLFYKYFNIQIINVNQPPTNISLAPSSISENQPSGTKIGSFSSTDPDIGDGFTYSLVSGIGDADNNYFNIIGNELFSKAEFDYELKHNRSIRIRTTDNGSSYFEKNLTITITNVNELPSDITLTPNSITENKPVNSWIGKLSAIDPDSAENFTFTFTPGAGSTDNQRFVISGSELRSNEIFNYETKSVYNIRVKTTNGVIESYEKALSVTIKDSSEAPVISGIETIPLDYNEDEPAKIISQTIRPFDEDTNILRSATIQISQNYLNTEDSIFYTPVVGLTVAYTNSGYLTATGKATTTIYENFLRNIRYKNFNLSNPSENDRVIRFTINDGTNTSLPAFRTIRIKRVNDPPTVINLSISANSFIVGETLKSQYTFNDVDGDLQGLSTFVWYSATSDNGQNKTIITGAVAANYLTSFNEGGKYISFTVTPVDSKGLAGIPVSSSWYYINAAPVFTDSTLVNTTHPGIIAVGETITANFPYYDKEGNSPGNHSYQWYYSSGGNWSSATRISGQSSSNYIISASYKNKYIAAKGVPKALTGSLTGMEYRTGWYLVGELPSAIISGIDTICKDGSTGILNVALKGTAPWSITYKVNNTNPVTIKNIYSESGNYSLTAMDSGLYTLESVTDKNYSLGNVSGQGIITYFQLPTAKLTLPSLSICSNDTATYSIPIALTGKGPWSVTYAINGINPKTIAFWSAKNASIKIKYANRGNYSLTKVADINCYGTVSGRTNVTERTSPVAVLTGDTTLCPQQIGMLNIALTGNGPWTFYYRKDNSPVDSLFVNRNINSFNYTIPVALVGNYRLVGVKDEERSGCVFGSATVKYSPVPTARIEGDINFCEGSTGTIDVKLTGTPPWKLKYTVDGNSEAYLSNISRSPYELIIYKPGKYTIDSVSDLHCNGTTNGFANLILNKAPKVSITGLDTVYTKETLMVPVVFNPPGGSYAESDRPKAILNISGSYSFSPLLADTAGSPHWIRYKYQDPVTSCIGKDSILVHIIIKDASIVIKNTDLDKQGTLCSNYGPILIGVEKKESDTGSFSIDGNPDALIPDAPNTAYLLPDKIIRGTRTVTYSYKVGGIIQQVKRSFTFENIDADFTWDNDCFSGTTQVNFADNTSIGDHSELKHHYWRIKYPTSTEEYDSPDLAVDFKNFGSFPVNYVVVSEAGCTDTVNKELTFKATYNINESSYIENFSEGNGNWTSKPVITDSANHWTLGRPNGEFFNDKYGARAWYTNILDVTESEHSYVESPCFNFEKAERPMVKMDIWRGFTNPSEIDGAALQYSTDNGQSWKTIGDVGDGINWYNSDQIEGAPGYQRTGWTSNGDYKQDTNWIECRHSLDNLIGKSRVKFRIIYSSSNRKLVRDGFAFDNFWVGERSKKILIEHFTNNASIECKDANTKLNNIANKYATDIIDLQYHMDQPEKDTFYILNPYPSYSRQVYYNITNIPYSILDGGGFNKTFNYTTRIPEKDNFIDIILQDNLFDLNVEAEYSGDMLLIGVDLVAKAHINNTPLTLHVVIIENEIKGITGANTENVFESVVRDMLPSTAGTFYNQSWNSAENEHIDLTWDMSPAFDRQQLRVVAFIQDENTSEIYQAAIGNPNAKTDIKSNYEKNSGNFVIAPNPTFGMIGIYWKKPVEQNYRIVIMDNLGRTVWNGEIQAGESKKSITMEGLDAGTYLLQVVSDTKTFESHKIILLDN